MTGTLRDKTVVVTDVLGTGHWRLGEAPQRVLAEINTFYPQH
ncbi:MAG: hypothetical protein JWQ81_6483 [Amycolatopsis sp.]|nr:hypothetical protein [Amycolatopsis sp.]MCU1685744.1 hypothetical protein [Amycolatopsis sp.]